MERTLAIIKPDGVVRGIIGEVIKRLEGNDFKIIAMKMIHMSKKQAEGFYAVHQGKPFFESLVEFMSSGPIIAAVLQKENAVEEYRQLIGATNPENAEEGTIRKKYAESLEMNAVHGSDSDENANIEADFFFAKSERTDCM